MRARGNRDLRGTDENLATDDPGTRRKFSRFIDLLCAGVLFLTAIAGAMLVPRSYVGRIWIYGTDLAVLFASMLNLLRVQNAATRSARTFSIIANVAMSALFLALMASIGWSLTLANAQIPAVAAMFVAEAVFSLRKSS